MKNIRDYQFKQNNHTYQGHIAGKNADFKKIDHIEKIPEI